MAWELFMSSGEQQTYPVKGSDLEFVHLQLCQHTQGLLVLANRNVSQGRLTWGRAARIGSLGISTQSLLAVLQSGQQLLRGADAAYHCHQTQGSATCTVSCEYAAHMLLSTYFFICVDPFDFVAYLLYSSFRR
jgi:hypothetical protein